MTQPSVIASGSDARDTSGDQLNVVVRRVTEAAAGVRSLELTAADGSDLPPWQPGAHIDVVISETITRQYSLCSDVTDSSQWRIGVLREPESRGGSIAIHALAEGDVLRVGVPRNNFALSEATSYLFIAGGIGITPLIPMIRRCEARRAEWKLVYGGRSLASMAFTDELATYGDRVVFWPQDEKGYMDLPALLADPAPRTQVYCCGPAPLLDAVEEQFERLAPHLACALHVERFRPKLADPDAIDTAFTVVCDYSDVTVQVTANESILAAVERAGIQVPSSCREGTCGTCETVVLEGIPDHRDSYLTPAEHASGEVMTPCCSRSKTPVIVLDL